MFSNELNLFNVGNIYDVTDNAQKAELYYSQAYTLPHPYLNLQNNHHMENLYLFYGKLEFRLARYTQAKNIIQEGLKDYPNSSELYIQLALLEYSLHNTIDAGIAAKRAYEITHESRTVYLYNQIINNQPIDVSNL